MTANNTSASQTRTSATLSTSDCINQLPREIMVEEGFSTKIKRVSSMDDSGTLFFDQLQQRFMYPSLKSLLDGTLKEDCVPLPATRRSTLSTLSSPANGRALANMHSINWESGRSLMDKADPACECAVPTNADKTSHHNAGDSKDALHAAPTSPPAAAPDLLCEDPPRLPVRVASIGTASLGPSSLSATSATFTACSTIATDSGISCSQHDQDRRQQRGQYAASHPHDFTPRMPVRIRSLRSVASIKEEDAISADSSLPSIMRVPMPPRLSTIQSIGFMSQQSFLDHEGDRSEHDEEHEHEHERNKESPSSSLLL